MESMNVIMIWHGGGIQGQCKVKKQIRSGKLKEGDWGTSSKRHIKMQEVKLCMTSP